MKHVLPDIDRFERIVFKKRDALSLLLAFSSRLLNPKHVGLLYGTNNTHARYLAPEKWDRGVMHKFNGKGISGLILKLFGRWIVQFKGLSPVRLFKETSLGDIVDNEGVIPYVLRKHREYYGRGISILVIDMSRIKQGQHLEAFSSIPVHSYDGSRFRATEALKVNNAIVRQFKAENFVSAYIPDYGAIVFNTIDNSYMQTENGCFVNEVAFKKRLDMLIQAIEMASLAHIGRARGKQAVRIIWHKEKHLRRTAFQLQQKEIELEAQRRYLRAVGAVNEQQLNMEAVNIPDGVYAFMDMVGSATIRKNFVPRDYFFILNLCHQIAADCTTAFSCRVDNFIGDCVFLQNASVFDSRHRPAALNSDERLMLMIFAISSILNQILQLKNGEHPIDREGIAQRLMKQAGSTVDFRAGLEIGSAMVGPLGSDKRKIVTAIGKSVNNASRLESSGKKNHIHVSEKAIKILDNAYLSKDTRLLWQKVAGRLNLQDDKITRPIRFWDVYQTYFSLDSPVCIQQGNVSYKEFSSKKTCLIRCVPQPGVK